ncbi:MAG: sulfur carrier protein ThiS [Lachnospiraceae bacterium]|nr:sulfur carrier protein ThiS [Lachnospiraceae bacterium]
MVKINGEHVEAAGQTLSQYLASTACNPQRIVIEYNGEILPRENYDTTVLTDDDQVEIISFMGGG